jgi:regulator of replication initiation timing
MENPQQLLSSTPDKPAEKSEIGKEAKDEIRHKELFTRVNSQCAESRKKIEHDVNLSSFIPLSDMGPNEVWAERKQLASSKALASQLCSNQLYYEVLQLKQVAKTEHKKSIEIVNVANREVKRLQAVLDEANEENNILKMQHSTIQDSSDVKIYGSEYEKSKESAIKHILGSIDANITQKEYEKSKENVIVVKREVKCLQADLNRTIEENNTLKMQHSTNAEKSRFKKINLDLSINDIGDLKKTEKSPWDYDPNNSIDSVEGSV